MTAFKNIVYCFYRPTTSKSIKTGLVAMFNSNCVLMKYLCLILIVILAITIGNLGFILLEPSITIVTVILIFLNFFCDDVSHFEYTGGNNQSNPARQLLGKIGELANTMPIYFIALLFFAFCCLILLGRIFDFTITNYLCHLSCLTFLINEKYIYSACCLIYEFFFGKQLLTESPVGALILLLAFIVVTSLISVFIIHLHKYVISLLLSIIGSTTTVFVINFFGKNFLREIKTNPETETLYCVKDPNIGCMCCYFFTTIVFFIIQLMIIKKLKPKIS
ncbi:hypothetical protein CDIK_2849 [Cucumispora dikerogammari]|nr:hypothetical protein CDIK_2849 [Cucumispora dikerogammari]